jgi:hypothetical protein
MPQFRFDVCRNDGEWSDDDAGCSNTAPEAMKLPCTIILLAAEERWTLRMKGCSNLIMSVFGSSTTWQFTTVPRGIAVERIVVGLGGVAAVVRSLNAWRVFSASVEAVGRRRGTARTRVVRLRSDDCSRQSEGSCTQLARSCRSRRPHTPPPAHATKRSPLTRAHRLASLSMRRKPC